ncbi:antibiotic ABC transporter ATP-binding protein [Streptomyces sp. NPDC057705]|uniref:antibiotic ABC transporter ATP-binding protein n=1 Tax=Streptomyces sp. NPDC057705 TaxID=3346222 RepID=UPI0036962A7C
MSRVVVVHGVGRQLDTAETLLAEVEPALRGGVGLALRRDPTLGRLAEGDIACAGYGDLYRQSGTRGEPYYRAEDVEPGFETELLEAWWREAARLDPRIPGPDPAGPHTPAPGAAGPHTTAPNPAARGAVGRLASRPLAVDRVRRALHALTRTRFFGAVSDRLLISDLKQVRRYFSEPELRAAVRARAAELITPETRVVVGHSLGSVVAYEALCALGPDRPPLNLVTLGSPLGLAGLVYDRLQPAPRPDGSGVWPAPVKEWTNLADRGDVVALVRELAPRFGPEVRDLLVDNGSEMHSMRAYLTAVETGTAIATGLAR